MSVTLPRTRITAVGVHGNTSHLFLFILTAKLPIPRDMNLHPSDFRNCLSVQSPCYSVEGNIWGRQAAGSEGDDV